MVVGNAVDGIDVVGLNEGAFEGCGVDGEKVVTATKLGL